MKLLIKFPYVFLNLTNYVLFPLKVLPVVILTFLISFTSIKAQTPVIANGKLKVVGTNLVNESGVSIQLRGMSSHGLNWFTEDYNFNSLNTLVNNWGIDVFRIAMYVTEQPDQTKGGYEGNPTFWRQYIDDLVDLCGQYGIYAIIDWHILNPGDPTDPAYYTMAKEFWSYMSEKHAGKDHVLYEIANEPNGVNWATCKEYAETIIPIIRANDPNTIIIIGNPTWSSDVNIASEDPVTGYDNLMYTFHFYAGSHTDSYRQKVTTALNNGIAVFATEWGTTSASGDGAPNEAETNIWMQFFEDNNISWCNWSYSDKTEASSALVAYSAANELWDNTSPSGDIVKNKIQIPADSWFTSGNIPPVVQINRNLYGAYVISGESVTLTADAIDADGSISSVKYYANGTLIGSANLAPYTVVWSPSTNGDVKLTAIVTDNNNATNTSVANTIHVVSSINQTAYPSGVPHAIPGIIKGIDFDNGGEMIAYHDLDGVHKGPAGSARAAEGADVEGTSNMGYVVNGEWSEYTCDVVGTGNYDFTLKVASAYAVTGKIHLEVDGVQKGVSIDVPSSGSWGNYQTVTIPNVPLTKGIQVIRLAIDKGYFNFSDLEFVTKSDPPSVALTAPTSGLSVAQGKPVLMAATASDSDGSITRVEFYVGTSKVAEDFTSPYQASWTAQLEGNYSITAVAVDNLGSTATSTAANITVTSDLQPPTTANLALNKIATASSLETSEFPASNAVDGSTGTRWSSLFADPQWLQVDLGSATTVNRVIINWEAAYATTYEIQVSSDATTWTSMAIIAGGNGSIDDIVFPDISARFVRIYGTERVTPYGYSLYEFEVYGSDSPTTPVDGVVVSPDTISLNAGQITSLIASVSPVNASNTTVIWSSSDTNFATVSISGVVTAKVEGTAIITATTVDGGYTGNCIVTVSDTLLPSFSLTTNVNGVGTIALNPATGPYIQGTVVSLTATASSGYKFVGWSGNLSGTANPNSITMDSDKTVTAIFEVTTSPTYSLIVATIGSGSVTLSPSGGVYDKGTVVTLTATPAYAYSFANWSGDVIGTSSTVTVTMDTNKYVISTFTADSTGDCTPIAISLPYEQNGVGEFCWTTSGTIDFVNSWNMTKLEINGVDFTNIWSNEMPPKIDGLYNIRYESSVGWSHAEINGTDDSTTITYSLTSTIIGEGSISPVSGIYDEGTIVNLTAIPASGWGFTAWSGDAGGTTDTTSITMDSDKLVTATFTEINNPVHYSLSVTTNGNGSVTLDPSGGVYIEGTVVLLNATPASGWEFAGWSGDVVVNTDTTSITMDSDKLVTATFTEINNPVHYSLSVTSIGNGSVTLDPSGGVYTEGTVVNLYAIPDSNNIFSVWSGDISGSDNPATIIMDSDKSLTASFITDNGEVCTFNTPLTTALPSINKSYKYIHVAGSDSNLSNITTFTINWDLSNNGLWQISANTNNGNPNWYVDLSSSISHSFGLVQPAISISGSGILGLDGDYWATLDGDNLVFVEKSNAYTLYFSNSTEIPCPEFKSTEHDNLEPELTGISVYPNPASSSITISGIEDDQLVHIQNTLGQVIYTQKVNNLNELTISIEHFVRGSYIISTLSNDNAYRNKIVLIH